MNKYNETSYGSQGTLKRNTRTNLLGGGKAAFSQDKMTTF